MPTPDPETPATEPVVEPAQPAPGVPLEQVKELVSSFRETMETFKATAPTPTGPDPAKAADEARARYDEVRKKANDLAATGDYAGSMEAMWQYIQSSAQASRPSTQDDPNVAALRNTARRLVLADNKDTFTKYGDEIAAEVKRLPIDKQISPEGWEDALRTVRAKHVDEILKEQMAAFIATEKAKATGGIEDDDFIPPIAGGSRGGRRGESDVATIAARLSAEEVGIATSFGMSREAYAKQKKEIGGRDMRVDLLPPVTRVEPGKF